MFVRPDTAEAMIGYLDALLEPPGQLVRAGGAHWPGSPSSAKRLGLRGDLVLDAYLAALALEQALQLVTFDHGFGRYPGLRWRCLLDD